MKVELLFIAPLIGVIVLQQNYATKEGAIYLTLNVFSKVSLVCSHAATKQPVPQGGN